MILLRRLKIVTSDLRFLIAEVIELQRAAFHYLVKPINVKKFKEVYHRAKKACEKKDEKAVKPLIIRTKQSTYMINHDDFMYVESHIKKLLLHTKDRTILFRWNPGRVYIKSASALSNMRTDDGKSGHGIMAGSGRVNFLFTVDGVDVRVNTFTLNQRWAMDSECILTGISKADSMVESLVAAGAKAGR